MNENKIDYQQVVKNVIHELTGDPDVWKEISYDNIREAATHLEWAVDLAIDKLQQKKQ